VYAYPGLVAEGQAAALRLFSSPEAAREASVDGLLLLYQWVLAAELKQPKKEWVFPQDKAHMVFFMGSRQEATRSLHLYLLRELFDLREPMWPDYRHFLATIERLQGQIRLLAQEMLNEVFDVVRERHASSTCLQRLRKISGQNQAVQRQLDLILEELEELVPADFLSRSGRPQIKRLPRYLRVFNVRAERAYSAPEKDRLKAEQLAPFRERFEQLKQEVALQPGSERLCFLDELSWMLEELKLSLFAPEIKVAFRISPKRLEEKFAEWQALKGR
jgi:ATP-dependent helicase HrpA